MLNTSAPDGIRHALLRVLAAKPVPYLDSIVCELFGQAQLIACFYLRYLK